MKSIVRWAIQNTPAMNIIMVAVLIVGFVSAVTMRREVFPEFELEIILVQVPFPGASPEEVEDGICQKVEEAVRSLDGIKKITSIAAENAGSVVLELHAGSNAQKILAEVRSEVDRIPSFPDKAEDPEVQQITLRQPAITVGVVGPESDDPNSELELRAVAEKVRDDLIRLGSVSQAEIEGAKPYQIDIEIPEDTLRRYGLSLKDVANAVRRENRDNPGGTIKTTGQNILVKGENKNVTGEQIAKIPLLTQNFGVVLTIGDLGNVRDEFSDAVSNNYINGKPGMIVQVTRTAKEDLLAMADAVTKYVDDTNAKGDLPPGYRLVYWADRSVDVRDRMNLLTTNGLQGLLLVLITLTLFLDTRLAFWVAMGIPMSILGACAIMMYFGETMNMLTMFAFLMALGIVVDDAIVVGENIYARRELGEGYWRAAINGTAEVLPSVASSVATTVVAFMPLFFITGVMGKFIACMPLAMIAMLIISLLESTFILPCHLAHGKHHEKPQAGMQLIIYRLRNEMAFGWRMLIATVLLAIFLPVIFSLSGRLGIPEIGAIVLASLSGFGILVLCNVHYPFLMLEEGLKLISRGCNKLLELTANYFYIPLLGASLRNPFVVVTIAITLLMLTCGLLAGGKIPFIVFPDLDSKNIEASITYPDGTPSAVTDKATKRLEDAILRVNEKYSDTGKPVAILTQRSIGFVKKQGAPGKMAEASGSHLGIVGVELVDTAQRDVSSQTILSEWRKEAGEFPGAETVTFNSQMQGPGGKAIEFRLLAKAGDFATLENAVEEVKDKLTTYAGVYDITDDSSIGKYEIQLKIKDSAKALGITQEDLDSTVRASYYGEEVMRVQRGRHEIKLMVRYPLEERKSLANFNQIRIKTMDGAEIPLPEVADIRVNQSLSEINRVDQLRSITISADVDDTKGNAREIVEDLRKTFVADLLQRYRDQGVDLRVRWEGQKQQTEESMISLAIGYAIAMLVMYVLLTLEFRSYFQPLLIMFIIPFGFVGAVVGHLVMQIPFTMFSVFGLVALTGVVVNDSIVLIDFINHRIHDGLSLQDALLDAGRRRLRPVLLTSVTTVAGLFPLLMERSFQAQILIPMAVSLAFGLMLTTLLVLFLVPTFYSMYGFVFGVGTNEEEEDDSLTVLPARPAPALIDQPQAVVTISAESNGNGHHGYATTTQKSQTV